MIRVFSDAGALFIDGRDDPMPAGTLVAALSGTTISISSIHGTAPLVSCDTSQLADINGAGFASAAAAMAYLAGVFVPAPAHTIAGVSASDVVAGRPLAISRASGQLVAARADTYAQAFVAGLATIASAAGFVAQAGRGAISLPDWTAIAGTPALLPGQPYFLAPAGGLSASSVSPGAVCVARVGLAASPTTLIAAPTDPILL